MAVPRGASGRNAGSTFPIDVIIVDTAGAAVTGTGNGYINDGVDAAIRATVVDYANSNPLTVRLTDTNGDYVAAGAGTQYTQDAALTVGTTVGGIRMGRASAAAPTGVSADDDAVMAWCLRNGATATVITAAGALIGGDAANGLDVDVTRMSALVAGAALIGKVGLDQTTPGTTNAVSLAQVGATTVVTGGVAGTLGVGGNVATNVAIGTNPINTGGQGVSSENTAVTTGRMVQFVADLVGKQIVLPYSNPENFVSFAMTSAMTGTTSTITLAAPAAGLRNYITQITVSSASTTIPTDIIIQDGNGGTTIYNIPCPIGTGTGTGTSGGTFVFPTPLRQPTTATAIYVANVTTGSSTKVSLSGYKGA